MKHRPAIQLRFRDPEQFSRIKENAAANDLSVNEYVLLAIEFAEKEIAKLKP